MKKSEEMKKSVSLIKKNIEKLKDKKETIAETLSTYWQCIGEFNNLLKDIYLFDIKGEFEIFLIRHGQGYHNENKSDKNVLIEGDVKFVDAELTDTGKNQAINAADEIYKYIENAKHIFLGASRLKRTWESIIECVNKLNEKKTQKITKEITIIPCLHEMPEASTDGKCDGTKAIENWSYGAGENKSKCVNPNKFYFEKQKYDDANCTNLLGYTIKWEYYNKFYPKDTARKHCRDTNIINEILNALRLKVAAAQLTESISGEKKPLKIFEQKSDEKKTHVITPIHKKSAAQVIPNPTPIIVPLEQGPLRKYLKYKQKYIMLKKYSKI